jgi:hypothetical protein
MGLDITAYEKVELVESLASAKDRLGDKCWDELYAAGARYLYAWPDHSFAPFKQHDGLVDGFYMVSGEHFAFRAGSYTGYSNWRDRLASMVGIASLEEFCENPQPGRFAELLNFADNEGVIGPVTSLKLFIDFRQGLSEAEEYATRQGDDQEWFLMKYRAWMRVFEIASRQGTGAVDFH